LKEEEMVQPTDANTSFDLQDHFQTKPLCLLLKNTVTWMLVNDYWEELPRLVTRDKARNTPRKHPRLKVIGDISCDIEGSV
jgi:hypothetical protein